MRRAFFVCGRELFTQATSKFFLILTDLHLQNPTLCLPWSAQAFLLHIQIYVRLTIRLGAKFGALRLLHDLLHRGEQIHLFCCSHSFLVLDKKNIQVNFFFRYPNSPFPAFLSFFAFMKSTMLHTTVLINSSAFENAVITDAPEW